MSSPIHAFDYLDDSSAKSLPPVCVAFGDDRFLKRLALNQLRVQALDSPDDDVPFASLEGDSAVWRDVADELSTVSLFGGVTRLVMVANADKFVTAYRGQLEDYVASPSQSGTLVLDVTSWPGNTRLYKSVATQGLAIECRPPEKLVGKRKEVDSGRLVQWITRWASERHQLKLAGRAVDQLLELVGVELGLLDQELAKLALLCEPDETVTADKVTQIVGGWRTQTTWDLLDAATDGNAAEALLQLDRLLQSGEHPQALFGAVSWSLRRFADATRIVEQAERQGQRIHLRAALETAGFRKWPREALDAAERQLKQLGRERAGLLYRWLLQADLALKGTSSSPQRARLVLEELIVRLSQQLRPNSRRNVAAVR
jgi:DNA polymerase-3 subunit delta